MNNLLPVPDDVPRLPSVLIYGRAVSRCGVSAPCRNRTCNLMIKSHETGLMGRALSGVKPAAPDTNLVGLVPPTHPNKARRFHDSIPELGSPSDLIYGNPDLVFAGGGWGTL